MTRDTRDALLRLAHDAHSRDLRRYVIRLTNGQTHLADDILQESITRLWCKPEILAQSSESVRKWLFTVARNLVIDNRRTAQFRHETAMAAVPDIPTVDAIESLLDYRILADALLTLSHTHRSTVLRAYYLAHSIADIARQDHIPEGTVKSRLHYALRAMRGALEQRGFEL